jgi:hypothetical protein
LSLTDIFILANRVGDVPLVECVEVEYDVA